VPYTFVRFHKNSSSGGHTDICRQTGGRTDMTKLTGAFCDLCGRA